MAVAASDMKFWLTGGVSNSDPDASIGGARSTTTQITDATKNNLFDDVSGDEASAGDTEYRCYALENDHATDTIQNVKVWINTETPGADSCDIALTANGKNSAAETPADEDTAPSGPTFSHPTTKAAGLDLGNMSAQDYWCIWIRRTVPGSCASYSGNSLILSYEGEAA